MRFALFAGLFLTSASFADNALPPLSCEGHAPDWTLSLDHDEAQFIFGKTIEMTIPQRTQVRGAEFPKALTLIAQRDTAIVILHQRQCDTEVVTAYPYEVNILTQKGEEPVILRGCCTKTQ
ncbi:MAG: hypothetical protein AAGA08_08535 [Pseudomonadota bacterium]